MKKIIIEPDIYTFDIDSAHHVSNITYIKWMEIGRNKLLEAVDMSVHLIEKLGFAPVLIRTEIAYKKPLYLGDKIRIELFFSKLTTISGTIKFKFIRGKDELVAEGENDALFFSLNTKLPYRMSEDQRLLLAEYLFVQ